MSIVVSVITPVYNGARHLRHHYELVAQCLADYNYEILYADNNSTDESSSILRSIAANDRNVIVFHCLAQGPSSARNLCLDNARGSILLYLDVDDHLLPISINHQLSLAARGIPSYALSLVDAPVPSVYPIWDGSDKLNFWLNFGNQGALSSFVCPNNPVRFDTSLNSSEDWLYVVNVREFVNANVRLFYGFSRIYNAGSGYSSKINVGTIKENHVAAFSRHYNIAPADAIFLFDFVFLNCFSLRGSFVFLKVLSIRQGFFNRFVFKFLALKLVAIFASFRK